MSIKNNEIIIKTETNNSIYDNALILVKDKISNITIRASTIHLIIKYVMETVEKTPIKGTEQKDLALRLIRALIVDLTDKEDEKILLKLLDDGTISNMIDLIVDATRGKLNINRVVTVSSKLISSCVPYLCYRK
tara:strand:+ start:90 stop:491 length:402 start_codon:yes stop_codon:yes gene_type:complete